MTSNEPVAAREPDGTAADRAAPSPRALPAPPRLPSGRTSIAGWVAAMQAHGLNSFTVEEAHRLLGGSLERVQLGLSRLAAKHRLIRPAKGLYVIISPEHQAIGAPPPLWYIDALMRHLELPYYVGLLSAAAFHGASQQAPQELQVVTTEALRDKTLGRGRIRWVRKHDLADSSTMTLSTPAGQVHVSTAETTALDLVHYSRHAGYLNNVATVLADLAPALDAERLTQAAAHDMPAARRVGYLLGALGHEPLAEAFWQRLTHAVPVAAFRLLPLDPSEPTEHAPTDARWRIQVNTAIDPD